MVKLSAFYLNFDRTDGPYWAGEQVSGTVTLTVDDKESARLESLSVTLTGEVRTNWVSKISDSVYDSIEPCLNTGQTLSRLALDGPAEDDRGWLMPSRRHRFGFRLQLPISLPSSYEGEFGHVRYTCVAEVQLTTGDSVGQQQHADGRVSASLWASSSSKPKSFVIDKPITIIDRVDIRQFDVAAGGCLRQEESFADSGCCGLSTGAIRAGLTISKSACLIGQAVGVEVLLDNRSRRRGPRKAAAAVLGLLQEVHFRSISRIQSAADSKHIRRVIVMFSVPMPDRGQSIKKQILLQIPHNLPVSSTGLNTITISYKLFLEIDGRFEIALPLGVASTSSAY